MNLSALSVQVLGRRRGNAGDAIPDGDLGLARVLQFPDFEPSLATVLELGDKLTGIRLHSPDSFCRRRVAFWRLHSRFCMQPSEHNTTQQQDTTEQRRDNKAKIRNEKNGNKEKRRVAWKEGI